MLTQTDLEKVAMLARLALTQEESNELITEIEKIIGYFQQIKQIDLQNVSPMTHAVSITLPLRPDDINPTKCLIESLPYKKFNHFFVPAVLE